MMNIRYYIKKNFDQYRVLSSNMYFVTIILDQDKPSFEVPAGAKGVSRTGRPVKSPVKWWEQGIEF